MGPLPLLLINLLKITVPSISNNSHEIEGDNASLLGSEMIPLE